MFSKMVVRILANYSTDHDKILHWSSRYHLQGIERRIFLITSIFKKMTTNFHRNLHFFIKTSAKNPLFIFFLHPIASLLSLLKHGFFIFISDDPERSSADNAEHLFSGGLPEMAS